MKSNARRFFRRLTGKLPGKFRWIIPVSISLVTAAILIGLVLQNLRAVQETVSLKTHGLTPASEITLTPSADTTAAPAAVLTAVPTEAPTAAPTEASPVPVITQIPLGTPKPTSPPAGNPSPAFTKSDGIDWYNGFADPRTITPETVVNPEDLTVLVNKYFALPESYSPALVLAESSKNQYIRTEADDAWDVMRAACETDTGFTLYLCSGYRTFEAQAALFSKSIRDKGIEHACSRNALEGRSEHNLGLALDISTTDVGVISSNFAKTTAGAWVVGHAYEYGFILRYPQDKTSITGYVYEPWHYRFVGTDLAGTLFASGQTLEEYYGKVPAVPAA